jgi:hypothetical protein
MNRFSPPFFLNALVITFVILDFLVAYPDEALDAFFHVGVHSEHHRSEKQVSTTTQSKANASERQRLPSHTPPNITPYLSATLNTYPSPISFSHIVCLSSVILRI